MGESIQLIGSHQAGLQLTEKQRKRGGGKRYLVLIEVEHVEEVETFRVDKNDDGNMDDWLPFGDIDAVRLCVGLQVTILCSKASWLVTRLLEVAIDIQGLLLGVEPSNGAKQYGWVQGKGKFLRRSL